MREDSDLDNVRDEQRFAEIEELIRAAEPSW